MARVKTAGAYGERLASRFHLAQGPTFVARTLRQHMLAVTEIRCEIENNGLSEPIPREDALLVTLQLRDCPAHDLWIDGKATRSRPLAAGDTSFYDLTASPVVNSISAFHNLHFYFPRAALDALCDHEGLPRLQGSPIADGCALTDPILRGLGFALRPAFDRPLEANGLFVDHITTAVAAHVARIAGGLTRRPLRGLSEGQIDRIRQLLRENLDGNLRVADLAQACETPASGLPAAFQRSTGQSLHQWLRECRVAHARDLLRTRAFNPVQIAAMSGFTSLSHMARAFSRSSGKNAGLVEIFSVVASDSRKNDVEQE